MEKEDMLLLYKKMKCDKRKTQEKENVQEQDKEKTQNKKENVQENLKKRAEKERWKAENLKGRLGSRRRGKNKEKQVKEQKIARVE